MTTFGVKYGLLTTRKDGATTLSPLNPYRNPKSLNLKSLNLEILKSLNLKS